jgi:protoporphyrinogen/coproporphyrinogen III oxidase
MRQIAIIGGGISGLAIAEAVERKSKDAGSPIKAIVLEADSAPGGKIKSWREEGFVVDTGPHGFLDKEPLMMALVERLGLSEALVRANASAAKRFVVRGGQLRRIPETPPAFVMSDVLPLGAKLRVLLEPWAARRPEGIDESVWAFAARRIGRVAADVLVDAMVTGIFGGDARELSLAAAFPRMRELEDKYGSLVRAQLAIAREKKRLPAGEAAKTATAIPAGTMYTFKEGLGQLTRALASRVEVRTAFEARSIERGSDRAWRAVSASGAVDADALVLAVPAFTARDILRPHAEADATSIGEIRYPPVGVVIHGHRASDLGFPLEGFGFLAPSLEGRRILGAIYASSVFPVHAPESMVMVRTIVGGTHRPEIVDAPDDELHAIVHAELHDLAGIPSSKKPVFAKVLRWPRAIPQYDIGHLARVAAADRIEAQLPGVFLSGNAFRGVAMIACVVDAEKVATRAIERVLCHEAKPAESGKA